MRPAVSGWAIFIHDIVDPGMLGDVSKVLISFSYLPPRIIAVAEASVGFGNEDANRCKLC